MDKRWRKFDELTSKCYLDTDPSDWNKGIWNEDVWDKTYLLLVDLINDSKRREPNFARELTQLEERMDDEYDICGWLDDYMDELEVYQQYDKLQRVCKEVLGLFEWREESPSELYFRIATALREQGKHKEALDYCEAWYKKEPDDILAAAAVIYARIGVKNFAGAEQIVKLYLSKDTECTDENDIIYMAAALLYKENGNKKAEKRVNEAIQKYEEELEMYELGLDGDDEDNDWDYGDLPFN